MGLYSDIRSKSMSSFFVRTQNIVSVLCGAKVNEKKLVLTIIFCSFAKKNNEAYLYINNRYRYALVVHACVFSGRRRGMVSLRNRFRLRRIGASRSSSCIK